MNLLDPGKFNSEEEFLEKYGEIKDGEQVIALVAGSVIVIAKCLRTSFHLHHLQSHACACVHG